MCECRVQAITGAHLSKYFLSFMKETKSKAFLSTLEAMGK